MFVLAEMKDTVRIPPWLFHLEQNIAIEKELNRKLANKVMMNVGLCIALFDITKLEESYIFPGDGASHTRVHFRYIVFRPFLDEILVGKIKNCSQDGVHVTDSDSSSISFYTDLPPDDILIPADSLQHPSQFDEVEQVWFWEYESEDNKHKLFMDPGEQIRFRVVDETFVDTSPSGPDMNEVEEKEKRIPYSLTGTIAESGLGLLAWWTN
ncbi:DNA-directed RNA polymerase III subunit RPC8-like [Centruroides sculpturatus]|uniref:DNA-directed RNA polymerase III subunit RPC8-like n=1 Tax=Centruroides sculpturatus TaxID=218467 RepID=UPI000C6DD630|nr:DNA-directed RNA polymerase III subunit RPC8-like [Centruroides sculpturatus]